MWDARVGDSSWAWILLISGYWTLKTYLSKPFMIFFVVVVVVIIYFLYNAFLAYGWRAGNLNWPIRIQQAGKIIVSWRQIEIKQLLSLVMALNIHEKEFTISKTKLVGKKWKIWTILCFWASVFAPKMGQRRPAWQLARSSSSIAT